MSAIWAGALLVVYLCASAVLMLLGAARLPTSAILLHLAVLAGVATTTWSSVVPTWLRRWAPLLTLLFLYSEMPLLISAAGHYDVLDPVVLGWERAWFGGQPSSDWARAMPTRWVSEPLHFAYLSYYAVIFAVPALLYVTGRFEEFHEAVWVLMLAFVICFTCYIVFPVAGPRYFWPSDAPTGPMRALATWLLEARSSRGTAFPSSHVAVAVTQSILAVRYFGTRGFVIVALSIGLALGAIYGGFHYAIDVVAGVGVAVVVTAAGLFAHGRRRRASQASAIAPT